MRVEEEIVYIGELRPKSAVDMTVGWYFTLKASKLFEIVLPERRGRSLGAGVVALESDERRIRDIWSPEISIEKHNSQFSESIQFAKSGLSLGQKWIYFLSSLGTKWNTSTFGSAFDATNNHLPLTDHSKKCASPRCTAWS